MPSSAMRRKSSATCADGWELVALRVGSEGAVGDAFDRNRSSPTRRNFRPRVTGARHLRDWLRGHDWRRPGQRMTAVVKPSLYQSVSG